MNRRTFLKSILTGISLTTLPVVAKVQPEHPVERQVANDLTEKEYQAVKYILMLRRWIPDHNQVRWGIPDALIGEQDTVLLGYYDIKYVQGKRLYFEAHRNFEGDYRDDEWLKTAVLDLHEQYNANNINGAADKFLFNNYRHYCLSYDIV